LRHESGAGVHDGQTTAEQLVVVGERWRSEENIATSSTETVTVSG
jgi:hypothetical protein